MSAPDPVSPPLVHPPLTPDESAEPRKLSPLKWLGGFLLFVAFMGGGAVAGIWLSGGHRRALPPTVAPVNVPVEAFIFFAIAGCLLVLCGGALYGLMLLTNAFTLSYDQPFLRRFKLKQWIGNLLVGMLIQSGLALMMAPALMSILLPWLPMYIAGMISFFGPFVLLQFFSTWISMWSGVMRSLTTRRLIHMGIPPEALFAGLYVGTSDPSKNSFRKLSLVEEDLGMLWVNPDGISYRGDTTAWDILREHVVRIERRADAGSVSAYFGAVAVILCYRDDAGQERRIRLHASGGWTMTAAVRRQNELADRLRMWIQLPPERASFVAGTVGGGPSAFPVGPMVSA